VSWKYKAYVDNVLISTQGGYASEEAAQAAAGPVVDEAIHVISMQEKQGFLVTGFGSEPGGSAWIFCPAVSAIYYTLEEE
jgi:hypothetical protein